MSLRKRWIFAFAGELLAALGQDLADDRYQAILPARIDDPRRIDARRAGLLHRVVRTVEQRIDERLLALADLAQPRMQRVRDCAPSGSGRSCPFPAYFLMRPSGGLGEQAGLLLDQQQLARSARRWRNRSRRKSRSCRARRASSARRGRSCSCRRARRRARASVCSSRSAAPVAASSRQPSGKTLAIPSFSL